MVTRPDPAVRLHGPRVTLRPMLETEASEMADRLAADRQTAPRWGANPATILRWLTDDDAVFFVAEVDGSVVGVLDYSEIDDVDYRSAGMDIGMFAGSTDRGMGTEALKVLAAYLIDAHGHHRLTIDPAADNARAIRAYEKVGFKPIGVARRYERGDDGTWHDNLLMDLLADELVRIDLGDDIRG